MKTFCLFLIICSLFLSSGSPAQTVWTPTVPVASGPYTDIHPVFANSNGFFSPSSEERLAFSRMDSSQGTQSICVIRTNNRGTSWNDSVEYVTNDIFAHDNPSMALNRTYYPLPHLILLWEVSTGMNRGILYSVHTGTGWSSPATLPGHQPGDHAPQVAQKDSGFCAAWERNGSIFYAEYAGSTWGLPQRVSPENDSLNSFPQVKSIEDFSSPVFPLIVWERRKGSSDEHAIMSSFRADTGWTLPDTVSWDGDNRNPKFAQLGFSLEAAVSFESNITGDWEIYSSRGYPSQGRFNWGWTENQSNNPAADDVDANFTNSPIITQPGNQPPMTSLTGGTWRTISGESDSIAVSDWTSYFAQYRSPSVGSVDRNPVISAGLFFNGLRVWSVWENNSTGHWKLYGSTADIPLGDVEEGSPFPQSAELKQNYPNPFNPSTTIRFKLQVASFTTLKIFDVLGREIATLVNEEMEAGPHEVIYSANDASAGNAPRLSSGVYLYRLESNGFVQVRKMLLVK